VGVEVTNYLVDAVEWQPDVLHLMHGPIAAALASQYSGVPAIYHCHGPLPPAEQPTPETVAAVGSFLAVSEETAVSLREECAVGESRIAILRNPIDIKRFHARRSISGNLRRLLLISNSIDAQSLSRLKGACKDLGVKFRRVGGYVQVRDVRRHIEWADAVVSLGRGALEAMSMARPAFVYDVHGCDGWITPSSYRELRTVNFSGRFKAQKPTQSELATMLSCYEGVWGPQGRELVRSYHDLDQHMSELMALYSKAPAVDWTGKPRSELIQLLMTVEHQDYMLGRLRNRPDARNLLAKVVRRAQSTIRRQASRSG
jgi:hypothetical protein